MDLLYSTQIIAMKKDKISTSMSFVFQSLLIFSLTACLMSCEEEKVCSLGNIYDLNTRISDVELFTLNENGYQDYNDEKIERHYDGPNFLQSFDFQTRHLLFMDSLYFNGTTQAIIVERWYDLDSVIIDTSSFSIEEDYYAIKTSRSPFPINFRFDSECLLNACSYIAATLDRETNKLNYLFGIDCHNTSYIEAAKIFYNTNQLELPDTIGIFELGYEESD